MKLKPILFALLMICSVAKAQKEFTKEWEMKASVPNKWNDQNSDLSLILMGDLKDIEMIDGVSGKSLWKFNIKEKLGVKSMEDWFFLWAKEGEPVEVVYIKPNEDAKTSVFLNSRTGNIESSLTESTLKDKTIQPKKKDISTLFANSATDETGSTVVSVNYKDKALKSAVNGSVLDLTVNASGGNNWTSKIKAKCVRHLCDQMLSAYEPEMMVNVSVSNGKVFVVYEGITVLDLKNGNVLWNTTFDNVQTSTGLKAKQEIGRSPMPVASASAVYICDFSKGEKAIKKLDINTGAELWRSESLKSSDVISQLLIVNNSVVARFGGVIRVEKFIPDANGGIGDGTYKVEYTYEGESEIRGYDANTGKQIWSTESMKTGDNFSKSECTILNVENGILACSDKNFYILNPDNGNAISKSELGKEIGKPQSIFVHNNNFITQGDKGIASFQKSGTKNYAVSTEKRLFSEFRGDAFIIWTGKAMDDMNEFVRFDLDNGKIYGKLEGTYRPRFDASGDYFIRFKDQTITKFKTN